MTTNDNDYSIIRPSGAIGSKWMDDPNLPQGIRGEVSASDWKERGFVQQTLVGASIRNFSINAQFGGSSSTLSAQLINDEFNKSDNTGYGEGDDPYHNGQRDLFQPPVVGSPVYFKFGKTHATVEQAYRSTFDVINETDTYPDFVTPAGKVDRSKRDYTGRGHITFGGILQSYTQTKNPEGSPLYNCQITDPREILKNVSIILNDYAGTTYNNKNLFNVYGFLEHDASDATLSEFSGPFTTQSILTKQVFPDGSILYIGDDTYTTITAESVVTEGGGTVFPITGQGFSRRNEKGIPWYRVNQALAALMQMNRALPQEYIDAGFGGFIDFRGYKYVVDLSGFPLDKIPNSYHLDYDSMDFMSLIQELGELINHELYVSLLPVIDHPSIETLYEYNKDVMDELGTDDDVNIISGIIRIDAIDRSEQPTYGSIKRYLDDMQERGVEILNQDVGFELSNVATDRFVVGAQLVEMYFFDRNKDKDDLRLREYKSAGDDLQSANKGYEELQWSQWSHETSLKQQALPFYGFLGNDKCVTIPRGFGPYKQILLDSSSVAAFGVGNYYLATEMEIRCAMKDFASWSLFLSDYNDKFIEMNQSYDSRFLDQISGESFVKRISESIKAEADGIRNESSYRPDENIIAKLEDGEVIPSVGAPRSVFHSEVHNGNWTSVNPCFPPYGFPVYWGRADALGLTVFGQIKGLNGQINKTVTSVNDMHTALKERQASWVGINSRMNHELIQLRAQLSKFHAGTPTYTNILSQIKACEDIIRQSKNETEMLTQKKKDFSATWQENLPNFKDKWVAGQLDKEADSNAKKVWSWLKKIGDENYGKKFLVKIPKKCNVHYKQSISLYEYNPPKKEDRGGHSGEELAEIRTNTISNRKNGPFGFRPLPVNAEVGYAESPGFIREIEGLAASVKRKDLYDYTLINDSKARYTNGALKGNFNPLNDSFDWNYLPEPAGGYFDYSVYQSSLYNLSKYEDVVPKAAYPPIVKTMLAPVDMENFLNKEKRMECYVRFDHSQLLNFGKIPPANVYRQGITADGFVPNLNVDLQGSDINGFFGNNIGANERNRDSRSFPSVQPSVAYVKCKVDKDLYMPPKTQEVLMKAPEKRLFGNKDINRGMRVFGVGIGDVFIEGAGDTNDPTEAYALQIAAMTPQIVIDDPDDPCSQPRVSYDHFTSPTMIPSNLAYDPKNPAHGRVEVWIEDHFDFVKSYNKITQTNTINTNLEDLDSDNVYAIVELPGIVYSETQTRYREDRLNGSMASELYKALTLDVVDRRVPGFDTGLPHITKTDMLITTNQDTVVDDICGYSRSGNRFEAYQNYQRAYRKQVKFAENTKVEAYRRKSVDSAAVEPDVFAIPLLSKERCYGPWISASQLDPSGDPRVRYSNIGGKIEYVKDEDLSPWKYNGYAEMNRQGYLKAQFTNSLLLFSERGGFVIPDIPSGIFMAKALNNGGPLVTNISCNIDSNGLSTTVKMDLYTTSFGKMSKANQDLIDRINRDSLKIRDRNNKTLRDTADKAQSDNLAKGIATHPMIQKLLSDGHQRDLDSDISTFNEQLVSSDARGLNTVITAVNQTDEARSYNESDLRRRYRKGEVGTVTDSAQVAPKVPETLQSRKERFDQGAINSDVANERKNNQPVLRIKRRI